MRRMYGKLAGERREVMDVVKEALDSFDKAANHARSLGNLDQEAMLKLYALYKQATVGKCNVPKPGFLDFIGKSKWQSWNQLGDMKSEDAKFKYIDLVRELDPQWDESSSEKTEKPKSKSFGVAVSTMQSEKEEVISDVDKTIFDWCKEGNLSQVKRISSTRDFDINLRDENGMTLLHWSCDRGHIPLVNFLIEQNADINKQDSELLTPLHYAAVCEHEDIIKRLSAAGADAEVKDNTGLTPSQSASSARIKSIFINLKDTS